MYNLIAAVVQMNSPIVGIMDMSRPAQKKVPEAATRAMRLYLGPKDKQGVEYPSVNKQRNPDLHLHEDPAMDFYV